MLSACVNWWVAFLKNSQFSHCYGVNSGVDHGSSYLTGLWSRASNTSHVFLKRSWDPIITQRIICIFIKISPEALIQEIKLFLPPLNTLNHACLSCCLNTRRQQRAAWMNAGRRRHSAVWMCLRSVCDFKQCSSQVPINPASDHYDFVRHSHTAFMVMSV